MHYSIQIIGLLSSVTFCCLATLFYVGARAKHYSANFSAFGCTGRSVLQEQCPEPEQNTLQNVEPYILSYISGQKYSGVCLMSSGLTVWMRNDNMLADSMFQGDVRQSGVTSDVSWRHYSASAQRCNVVASVRLSVCLSVCLRLRVMLSGRIIIATTFNIINLTKISDG